MTVSLEPLSSPSGRAVDWPPPFWDETVAMVEPDGPSRAWCIADGCVLVGVIGASDVGDGVAQIGYGVVPSVEGRGVATAAARALRDLLRSEGFAVVRGNTFPDHVASRRVMEKAGMVHVGTASEDGQEVVVYELRFPTRPGG